MKIFEREETPDLIKVTISCQDRRVNKETFDIVDSDLESVFVLFDKKAKSLPVVNSNMKSVVNLREYKKKALGRSKNIRVIGMDPMTLSVLFKSLIKSKGNE